VYHAPPRPALPPELDPRGPGRIRSRRSRGVRVVAWLCVFLSVVILGVTTAGYVLLRYYDGRIERLPFNLGKRPDADRPPAAPSGAVNYLLVGSDTRAGADNSQYGGPAVTGQRSDSVLLVHLSADGTSTVVSVPRDTVVQIPAYTTADGAQHEPVKGRINEAFARGGGPLLVQTVELLSHVRIDHYVQVDFAGFKRITEALGGVEVCLKKHPRLDNLHDVVDSAGRPTGSGFSGREGTNRLSGDQALAFVRQRNNLPGGDLDRIKRQQQFIGSVVREATSAGMLVNPVQLNRFLGAVTDAVGVDGGTDLDDLRRLATRLRGLQPGKVAFETIPVYARTYVPPGAPYYLYTDPVEIDEFFRRVNSDRKPEAVLPDVRLTVPPARVRVSVENGTATPGLAARTRDDLRAAGFRVTEIGNRGDGQVYPTSEVRFSEASRAAAVTVLASVAGARPVKDDSVGDRVVLVVGDNYRGAKSVQVGEDAPAVPTAPAAGTSDSNPVPAPTDARPGVPRNGVRINPTERPTTAADPGNRCTY
jgi:LCP family protein required for cell wall assembly